MFIRTNAQHSRLHAQFVLKTHRTLNTLNNAYEHHKSAAVVFFLVAFFHSFILFAFGFVCIFSCIALLLFDDDKHMQRSAVLWFITLVNAWIRYFVVHNKRKSHHVRTCNCRFWRKKKSFSSYLFVCLLCVYIFFFWCVWKPLAGISIEWYQRQVHLINLCVFIM